MKISKLKINPKNPQIFDDLSKLEKSIKDFPKMMKLRPLIYDPKTMIILGGNKRLICLKNMGYKDIPDEWLKSADELTEQEKQRFVLADNIMFGEFDIDKLNLHFPDFDFDDLGLDLSDSLKDIDKLKFEDSEGDPDESNSFSTEVILIRKIYADKIISEKSMSYSEALKKAETIIFKLLKKNEYYTN